MYDSKNKKFNMASLWRNVKFRDGFLDRLALHLRSDGSDGGIKTEAQTASKALWRGCIEFEAGQKD